MRGVELVLYKGLDAHSGYNAGRPEMRLPQSLESVSDELTEDSSEGEDEGSSDSDVSVRLDVYGGIEDADWGREIREAQRYRRERKAKMIKRAKERKRRRREMLRRYSLWVICVSLRDA